MLTSTPEYAAITQYYGDRVASRSQVPLINHISEGIDILHEIGGSELSKRAFMIHPIVQTHEEHEDIVQQVASLDSFTLACEYRDFANTFLCKPETDHVRSVSHVADLLHTTLGKNMSVECCDMLIADKRQNRKDFLIYHHGTHARSKELLDYFNVWLDYLYLYRIHASRT